MQAKPLDLAHHIIYTLAGKFGWAENPAAQERGFAKEKYFLLIPIVLLVILFK